MPPDPHCAACRGTGAVVVRTWEGETVRHAACPCRELAMARERVAARDAALARAERDLATERDLVDELVEQRDDALARLAAQGGDGG